MFKFIKRWLSFLLPTLPPMGMRIGYFDPIELTFNVINSLMAKGILTLEEAKTIIKISLPKEMPEQEKETVLSGMFKKNGNK